MGFNLQRFIDAQNGGESFNRALSELRAGHKTSHWMWFVFPQIADLGQSAMSRRYAIISLEEAHAYLAHPVLGSRLVECAQALLSHRDPSAREILGEIDAIKLRSSMTLFARSAQTASPSKPSLKDGFDGLAEATVFQQVLDHYFDGEADGVTERLL